jgi:hypothetical protein
MAGWHRPVYKTLAESELGAKAGHTSGIVPTKETQPYFGKPLRKESHRIRIIFIDFWYGKKHRTITTNVMYYHSKTHDHIHMTGNIMPEYKTYGAQKGNIVVFWKSMDDDSQFIAELIEPGSTRWSEIKHKGKFPKGGGEIELPPPGVTPSEYTETDEINYQKESSVEDDLTDTSFPSQKRSEKKQIRKSALPPRNKAKGDYVLKKNEYRCQIDNIHRTFPTEDGHEFMEKHHLIPMEHYDAFENDIDDISNITSLCPTCHKLLHYGIKKDRDLLLEKLWNQQKDGMKKRGIFVELSDLKAMY